VSSLQLEIPIFPLSDVVFFPGTLLPLHIFEPRYRQMVKDALEGDRRIGMVLANSAWEADASVVHEVHAVGGLGKISEVEELEDGKYDIVLSGTRRFRILEFVSEAPYRLARVELLEDPYLEQPEDQGLVRQLITGFRDYLGPDKLGLAESELLAKVDLATLANSVCSAVRIPLSDKQALLEVDEVRIRAEAVLAILDQLLSRKRFIAGFSRLRPDDPGRN
jgi:uncharacterized protein